MNELEVRFELNDERDYNIAAYFSRENVGEKNLINLRVKIRKSMNILKQKEENLKMMR